MAKLEDRFNETLVESRDKIKQIIQQVPSYLMYVAIYVQQFEIFSDESLKASIIAAMDTKHPSHEKSQKLV